MRIDEIFNSKQKTKVRSIVSDRMRKIEFNLIEILTGKSKSNITAQTLQSMQPNSAYNLSVSKVRPPDWNKIYTKSKPAMSDEEFEKAISALAVEFTKKSTEIENSGKSKAVINSMLDKLKNEYDDKKANLELQYVSVVSPDRKAAYAKADLGKGLLEWGPNGWVAIHTVAEKERIYKFADIYEKALKA